jgi:hypothetical protein
MRRVIPALLAAALPFAALAQGMDRGMDRGMDASPHASPEVEQRLRELRQGSGQGAGTAPDQGAPLARQQRSAGQADTSQAGDDAGSLLRLAEEAANRRQWSRANEYLERASTRLLTRSIEPARAGVPLDSGAVGAISAAREAVARRDRAEATRQIATAQSRAAAAESMTGAPARGAGSMGGGGIGGEPAPAATGQGSGSGIGAPPLRGPPLAPPSNPMR